MLNLVHLVQTELFSLYSSKNCCTFGTACPQCTRVTDIRTDDDTRPSNRMKSTMDIRSARRQIAPPQEQHQTTKVLLAGHLLTYCVEFLSHQFSGLLTVTQPQQLCVGGCSASATAARELNMQQAAPRPTLLPCARAVRFGRAPGASFCSLISKRAVVRQNNNTERAQLVRSLSDVRLH
jgi:hypothetical protein